MTPSFVFDRIAQLDQVEADLRSWAKVYGGYRESLIEEGFDPDEAFSMVMSWQQGMFTIQAHIETAAILNSIEEEGREG